MPLTLSVVSAAVGGFAGHTAVHPQVAEAARGHLATAVVHGVLSDAQVYAVGDRLALLLAHPHGLDAEPAHRAAFEALTAAAEVAARLHQHGPGRDLMPDAFTGDLRAAGPAVAEIELTERPSEPLAVFLGSGAAAGSFNLPLARAFADPFTTPGLVLAEPLHAGFSFEVHDVTLRRKVMFNTPEETYGLLSLIGLSARFEVRRVVSRTTGEVAAATATAAPVAVVRAHGAFPGLGELTEPYATPHLVDGSLRGAHIGPWMPVGLADASGGRFDGPPRVVALALQVAEGRLGEPRDLFADVSFEGARRQALEVTDYLRRHGPFTPHRIPLDEVEVTALPPAAARFASRWSNL
ncbi:MAG: fructose 1,6-bisphosphatase [Chloroflexota bacterium]